MTNKESTVDISGIATQLAVEGFDDDFIILEDIRHVPFFDYPTKINVAVATLCLKGDAQGSINLKPYKLAINDFFVTLPGEIVQFSDMSSDFRAIHIIMSERFLIGLEINYKEALPIHLRLKEHLVIHLDEQQMNHILDYYTLLRRAVGAVNNPNRGEILRLLTKVLFYELNDFPAPEENKKAGEELFHNFYVFLLRHYRNSREVGFYADKMFITPKYLSFAIKKSTGKSAFEWINNYVILEAKSMLKSTPMTIQQIADYLNFPNQSFFGKYFKQHVGISPKEYRNS